MRRIERLYPDVVIAAVEQLKREQEAESVITDPGTCQIPSEEACHRRTEEPLVIEYLYRYLP